MMTIQEFCEKHDACKKGREWAVANCRTMQEVWDTVKPEWLVWVATREGVLSDSELRLFACWCVRQAWHLLTDQRSRNAVEVAERFATGESTNEELDAACDAACDAARAAAWDAEWDAARAVTWDAARAAARAAAWDAARAAACDAARAVTWDAACDAARVAACDAAWAAARAVTWDAACDAAQDAQSDYLRKKHQPFRAAAGGEGK